MKKKSKESATIMVMCGKKFIKKTSDQSFKSLEDYSVFLQARHGSDPDFKMTLAAAVALYPDLEHRFAGYVKKAYRKQGPLSGSPVPHTVTAKESVSEGKTILGFIQVFAILPVRMWSDPNTIAGALMPTYYQGTDWPPLIYRSAQLFGFAAMVFWLSPGVPTMARIASLVFHGGNAYLTYFPYFPFPWYFPILGLFGALAWAGAFGRLYTLDSKRPKWVRWSCRGTSGFVAGGVLLLTI